MIYLTKTHDIVERPLLYELVIQVEFYVFCLILFPGNVMKVWASKFLFVTPSRTLFLLLRLVLMVTSTERGSICDVLQSTTSMTSSPLIIQVDTLPQYLDQWRGITYNRFVINMLKGIIFSLAVFHYFSMHLNGLH